MKISELLNRYILGDDDTEFDIMGNISEEQAREIVEALKKYLSFGSCSNCGYAHRIGVCADCGYQHAPSPQALTLCSRCGKLHQFDENLKIHPVDMPANIRPEVRTLILQAQKNIRERFS